MLQQLLWYCKVTLHWFGGTMPWSCMKIHRYLPVTANEYREMLNFEMTIRESSCMILLIMIANLYVTRSLNFLFRGHIQVRVSPSKVLPKLAKAPLYPNCPFTFSLQPEWTAGTLFLHTFCLLSHLTEYDWPHYNPCRVTRFKRKLLWQGNGPIMLRPAFSLAKRDSKHNTSRHRRKQEPSDCCQRRRTKGWQLF